jgi:hypothetical protein
VAPEQVGGVSLPLATEQGQDVEDQAAVGRQVGAVEATDADEFLSLGGQAEDGSVPGDLQTSG